jgi:hypothetical protein
MMPAPQSDGGGLNEIFLAQGHALFCEDLRPFRQFSKNPLVSATRRRSPTLQVCRYWNVPTTPCFRPIGAAADTTQI